MCGVCLNRGIIVRAAVFNVDEIVKELSRET
jgi:hypothetical protein